MKKRQNVLKFETFRVLFNFELIASDILLQATIQDLFQKSTNQQGQKWQLFFLTSGLV
jgi:hypothetical protein